MLFYSYILQAYIKFNLKEVLKISFVLSSYRKNFHLDILKRNIAKFNVRQKGQLSVTCKFLEITTVIYLNNIFAIYRLRLARVIFSDLNNVLKFKNRK